MASNGDTPIWNRRRRLMEGLASSLIGLFTVGRPARVSCQRINQEIYKQLYKRLNWCPHETYKTGSRFEGMPMTEYNDEDRMYVKRHFPIVLLESQREKDQHEWGYVKAEFDTNEPVYLKLKTVDKGNLHADIRSMIDNDGYLKTNAFLEHYKSFVYGMSIFNCNVQKYKIHGPAIPINMPWTTDDRPTIIDKDMLIMMDMVFCLKFQSWPSITNGFFTRERPNNNWPSRTLLDSVSSLECLVVPVGRPNSKTIDTEWRLSFSVAEGELIHNMPEPYVRCMCALKVLKQKYIVYDESDKPTPFCSYFIKTACLWMCETLPHKDYSIMDLIKKTIEWLISCYEDRHLPHYFIPQQNLIGHLASERCDEVITRLTVIKGDLWKMLMASVPVTPDIRDVINNMYDKLNIIINTRDYTTIDAQACIELEILLLKHPKVLKWAITKLLQNYIIHELAENSFWAGHHFSGILELCETGLEHGYKLPDNLPEEIILPIVRNIENIVSEGQGEMFKHRLYRYIGDLYTYLLFHYRKVGIVIPLLYFDKPLQYYEMGTEMVFPDKFRDCIGGQLVIVIHHYVMGNYKELNEKLATLKPTLFKVSNDEHLMNRQIPIQIPTYGMVKDTWAAADDIWSNVFAKRIMLCHPIALVLYINARMSIREGDIENAHLMVKEMKKCSRIILKWATTLLIGIIQSLIGLLEVMRMVYLSRER